LRDLLETEVQRAGIKNAVLVGRVWELWGGLVGRDVAAHAEPTSLKHGILRVRADSPAWATELSYLADDLRRRINQGVGNDVVGEVRVWSGPGPISSRPTPVGGGRPPDLPPTGEGDPLVALTRAREAWSRRRRGGR
jgi:predicted nucleic acid-binding Zn ribbon protein